MENKEKKVVRISRKKFIVTIIVIVVLFILGWGIYLFSSTRNFGLDNKSAGIMSPQMPSVPGDYMEKSNYPRNQNNTPSINDTREFMKTNYDTEIQTRNVKSTLREVKGAIKVANGRIDSLNENPKNGYVRFVVPKVNFESFKEEIESITHEKLITENISSENLLSQKQSIEQQQQNADNSLALLKQQQKDLLAKHTQAKNKLQSELTTLQKQRDDFLSKFLPNPSNPYPPELYDFAQKIEQKNQQITSENSNFNTKNQNLKNQIDSVNSQISGIKQQDENFTDNIETVNGSISVKWISLWHLARIFSPISPVIIIIILVIGLWYFLKRKNYIPGVELV